MTTVYELIEGNNFNENETGVTGVKVFTDIPNSSTPVELPLIGDQWDSTYDLLLVRSIDKTLICKDKSKWVVNYSTRDEDDFGGELSEENLPVQISMGVESVSWTPPSKYSSNFTWVDATGYEGTLNLSEVKQNINLLVGLTTYTFTRRVNDLISFKIANYKSIGRINATTFYGLPRGLLLYKGSEIDSYKDNNGRKSWLARLTFVQRITTPNRLFNIDGEMSDLEVDGWQYALREADGEFSRPYFTTASSYLYSYADFKGLITSGYGIRQPNVGVGK